MPKVLSSFFRGNGTDKESGVRYEDSIEDSAKFLRLALQYMTRQAAALHPISYAVWYEYASGRNAALNAAVDSLTREGGVLDEASTDEIFRQYIAAIDAAAAERISQGFQKVMADVLQSAAVAGDHADRFGGVLEKWSEEAGGLPPGSELGLDQLLQHTRSMQGSISTLKGRLDASRREIEQLRQEISRAREESLADSLTGLVNRKGFDLALAACLAKLPAPQAGPSLLITDIDFFKRVNDTYGHLFGDKVIHAVAQILKHHVQEPATAARYGGEEFVLLLPEMPLEMAHQLAEKIRATVENCRIRRVDKNETVANVTVSIGVASYRAGESASEFIARADQALYASKHAGRNRVTLAAA